MKTKILIIIINVMFLELFAAKQTEKGVNIQKFNVNAIIVYLKSLSFGELKAMLDFLNAIETQKQKETRRIKELKRILEEKRRQLEEKRMLEIIKAKLKEHFGRTSFLHDFFTNRI